MLARKLDLLPRHVHGEVGHFSEVEEQVDRPVELDLELDQFLELLEVGEREFAEYGDQNFVSR